VESDVKLDITTGAFGTGEVFEFNDASTGQVGRVSSSIPTTAHNQPGRVSSPPVWAPQLTAAVRFSDLLKPRILDIRAAKEADGDTVEDHMQNELWDIEVDFIYYLTSVYDRAEYRTRDARLKLRTIDASGVLGEIDASPGDCLERDPMTNNCVGDRLVKTELGGQDQWTVRVGGEYNVLPGLVALRAGLSYESRGQDPEMLNVLGYMLGRTGLHTGFTLRIAGKTDISLGYAHFIQEDVRLQVYEGPPVSRYPPNYKTPDYNFMPGEGVGDRMGMNADAGGFDGMAGVEVPNADLGYEIGPYFVNAGSYYYHLDTLSVSVTQHF
jgi:hypothetical protein